jgi:hypothetical protein
LPPTTNRHVAVQYQEAPGLGYYVSAGTLWTHRRVTEDGREFVVQYEGDAPTPEQIGHWKEIDSRLPELIQTAIAAVVEPDTEMRGFSRTKLYLSYIQVMSDGEMEVSLDPCFRGSEGMDESPLVVFRDWQAVDSYWST